MNPNILLVVIMLIVLASNALLLARPATPPPVATPTSTATPLPVDDHSDGMPVGRENARLVVDGYCAGGVGWQWLESVPDGQGGENEIIKGACNRE